MATAAADDSLDSTALFHQLDSYPWDDDQEFQGGLNAILGSVQDPSRVEHLTLRAKCYYFARKAGAHVDFDGYERWVSRRGADGAGNGAADDDDDDAAAAAAAAAQQGDAGPAEGGIADAPKPASFADICELIAEGKPIPGIKDIPDTILEGQASESQAEKRKKPWEKEANANENPSWMSAQSA